MVNCTEGQFFGIFRGYIHDYYPKTGNYNCIFKGVSSYHTLSSVLGDDNWDIKYFSQQQQTFVLSYQQSPNPNDLDPLQEPDPLQESDPLQEHDPPQEPLQDQNKTSMHTAKKTTNI
ncbi:hypothetical protein RhiirA4_481274 [Rhizophagus irregularis]|uniref:Uncharacterized protein n=1 Tax=Rhizophagus irregularis TaxID=588596 RepID=A0A2I1HJA4_9GLOM|nr:hypothetical protein RhiirA4_481274 [Rhizophagus irregularis]